MKGFCQFRITVNEFLIIILLRKEFLKNVDLIIIGYSGVTHEFSLFSKNIAIPRNYQTRPVEFEHFCADYKYFFNGLVGWFCQLMLLRNISWDSRKIH